MKSLLSFRTNTGQLYLVTSTQALHCFLATNAATTAVFAGSGIYPARCLRRVSRGVYQLQYREVYQ
jgi:hypothetical protein